MIRSTTPENTAKQMFQKLDATLRLQSNVDDAILTGDNTRCESDGSECCQECVLEC